MMHNKFVFDPYPLAVTMQRLAEPKYDTMEELLEINKNRKRKRGVWLVIGPVRFKWEAYEKRENKDLALHVGGGL